MPHSTRPVRREKIPRMSPEFWRNFAQKYWEKKALVIPQFDAALTRIDGVQIFAMLVNYAQKCRREKNVQGFKFFVNGQRLHDEEVVLLLPVKGDKTLLGYHRRMEVIYDDYCLVCDELLQSENSEFRALREFTTALFKAVGLPQRFAELGLYLGNYRRTPFGVHVDACGVFSFPVVGQKTFRLWSEAYVKQNPKLERAQNYQRHLKASRLLTVGVGGLSYWPSKDWHIAESKGEFSATWSLGVWVDRTARQMVSEVYSQLVDQVLALEVDAGMSDLDFTADGAGQVHQLPLKTRNSIHKLRQLSAQQVDEFFLRKWLQHLSMQGFKTLPKSLVRLRSTDAIRLRDPGLPILWCKRRRRVFFAAHGILVDGPTSPAFLRLIKKLNGGKVCKIKDELKTAQAKDDLRVLQLLAGSLVKI